MPRASPGVPVNASTSCSPTLRWSPTATSALHACAALGEHTDALLESLGYSWDDIVALKMNGAIL